MMLQLHVEQEFLNCTCLYPTTSRQEGSHLPQESWDVCAMLGSRRAGRWARLGQGSQLQHCLWPHVSGQISPWRELQCVVQRPGCKIQPGTRLAPLRYERISVGYMVATVLSPRYPACFTSPALHSWQWLYCGCTVLNQDKTSSFLEQHFVVYSLNTFSMDEHKHRSPYQDTDQTSNFLICLRHC